MVEAGEAGGRLLVSLGGDARGQLEALAREDGLSLAGEVRRLVVAEAARRHRREVGVPEKAIDAVARCLGCQRWG